MVDELRLAVRNDADGDRVFRLSADRAGALRSKDELRSQGTHLWCSRQAGGCGGRLQINAGEVVRPYLKHTTGAGSCALAADITRAEHGYEHLLVQHTLRSWLEDQGLSVVLEKTIHGGRVDLLVRIEELTHVLEVQLTPISNERWQARDAVYRHAAHDVTWLYGPRAESAAAREQALRGVAVHLDHHQERIGIAEASTGTSWSPLSACRLDRRGFWTPGLDAAIAAHEAAQRKELADRHVREAKELQARLEAAAARRRDEEQRAAEDRRIQERAATVAARPVETLVPGLGGLLLPLEGYPRSLAQWVSAHPDASGWAPPQGWAFLYDVPDDATNAAKFVTYLVTKIYGSGPVTMFAIPGIHEHLDHIVDALQAVGLIHLREHGGTMRWERPGSAMSLRADLS